ncbi:MAG: DUF5312 domain-containing protein [Treponema sp.]|jgi:hypothetical protein|nr:DUF5312 domain-containing protein [Treponema sp.]
MTDNEHFDRLVSSLSLSERQSLLEKLKSQSLISQEPLYVAEKETGFNLDIEEQYFRLAWYYRLWYFILGILRSKLPVKVFEEQQVSTQGQIINERCPGLFDYQSGKLLQGFYAHLDRLKTASRFFYTALDAGFNRDKGAFYAFLGSLEMASVHAQLTDTVNPVSLEEKNPHVSQSEMRQIGLRVVEDALRGITEEHRAAMYFDARILFCLKELSVFPYDRIIMAFSFDSSKNGNTCSINIIKEMLISLSNILFSFKEIPPMALLESLFVFLLQERASEKGFEMSKEIHALMTKAEEALVVIRGFNRQVPLANLLRCAGRNNSVRPREISGGEDWYSVYRDYWKRLAEDKIILHFRNRRQQELLISLGDFLNGANLTILGHTESETNPEGFPLKGALNLSFLLSFYSSVFMPDINVTLKSILLDGEFSKKENRNEYNECYNRLIKMDDMIKKLESQIAPSGDYGNRYVQARHEVCSLVIKSRKIQIISDEASSDAVAIIEDARRSVTSMIYVLGGILGMDAGGRYFPLSNLAKLSDDSGEFIKSINEAVQKFQKTLEILDEIDSLDIR